MSVSPAQNFSKPPPVPEAPTVDWTYGALSANSSTAAWAREHGARWAVLQVGVLNVGARAVYRRLGFREHHRYRYLVPP